MVRRIVLIMLLVVVASGTTLAQTGGQLWVRAYEDRNGSGSRDAGEPLLTRGVSVNLLNAEGVVIASGILDTSPNAGQGLIGFQLLPPGDYSVVITSADYTPTTGDTLTATVSGSGVPPVLEFGAQPVQASITTTDASGALGDVETVRMAAAAGGALAVICVMAVVGYLFYLLNLRRRLIRATAADARMTTGSMRPVRTGETGQFRTATGEFRPPTGEFRRPGTGEYPNPRGTGEQPKP